MKIISIDIGGTNTHGVIVENGKIRFETVEDGNMPEYILKCFNTLKEKVGLADFELILTGGGARKTKNDFFSFPFKVVDEISAIGKGGIYLSGNKDVFVVSIGTGTAFVSVKDGKIRHVGGTGVGGGTIYGLSKLLLKTSPDNVEKLAKVSHTNLDITVKDIVGGDLDKIPSDATASNFGKAEEKEDEAAVAASLLNMIGETIGVMTYFAAKSVGQEEKILLCGRVAKNFRVKKRVVETIKMFGGKAEIPERGEYCAAIGAAI
jgi:type II pantothenate kinase